MFYRSGKMNFLKKYLKTILAIGVVVLVIILISFGGYSVKKYRLYHDDYEFDEADEMFSRVPIIKQTIKDFENYGYSEDNDNLVQCLNSVKVYVDGDGDGTITFTSLYNKKDAQECFDRLVDSCEFHNEGNSKLYETKDKCYVYQEEQKVDGKYHTYILDRKNIWHISGNDEEYKEATLMLKELGVGLQ